MPETLKLSLDELKMKLDAQKILVGDIIEIIEIVVAEESTEEETAEKTETSEETL